jgi:hypothetical protein
MATIRVVNNPLLILVISQRDIGLHRMGHISNSRIRPNSGMTLASTLLLICMRKTIATTIIRSSSNIIITISSSNSSPLPNSHKLLVAMTPASIIVRTPHLNNLHLSNNSSKSLEGVVSRGARKNVRGL